MSFFSIPATYIQRAVSGQDFRPGPLTATSQWRRRRASKCPSDPTRRHLNSNFGLCCCKADEEQGRLSTNVSSPHIWASHRQINSNERLPPPSDKASSLIQGLACAVYRACDHCWGFAFVGTRDRTKNCLGIKPIHVMEGSGGVNCDGQ